MQPPPQILCNICSQKGLTLGLGPITTTSRVLGSGETAGAVVLKRQSQQQEDVCLAKRQKLESTPPSPPLAAPLPEGVPPSSDDEN